MKLNLFTQAEKYTEKIALVTENGHYTYQQLLERSRQIAIALLENNQDLNEQRVAFLIPPSFEYVATLWGIWQAGGIAVPLCLSHPRPELEYVITHADASIALCLHQDKEKLEAIARENNVKLMIIEEIGEKAGKLPEIEGFRRALMLYTSGTTGKPKGVVTTHDNIAAQVSSLVEAWGWTEDDKILHILPLHHIHGIINVLTCALAVGGECHFLQKFDATRVWKRFCQGNLTLFMAVPTIYAKLIAAWENVDSEQQKKWSAGCEKMRLMVSGSAALPVSTLEKWQNISGHFLLERYGMTEIGMALSNPLKGQRLAGFVGTPLPKVQVRLVGEEENVGEIQVKGATVFKEYWRNPEATANAFQDGWFSTGDLAMVENGNYRILGRLSVDIIKTGGYKVSALEIEEFLRAHPNIQDCAVVGLSDQEWGERVAAAIVLKNTSELTLESLRNWAKERLAVYKVPTRSLIVEELPRNAMGKVTKPEVVKLFKN